MPTIAVCVIAKNEEKNVKRMSDSLKGLFDQYVFVDTGSTDATQEIAEKEGWELHHFEWCNNFAKARNFAFSKATTDFVFWCDLDDVLTNPEGFKAWKEMVMPLYDYHMANYDYASDASGKPVCTFVRERVVRRSKGMKWEYPIHEGITPNSGNGPVSVNFTPMWKITHMRTMEDLNKDKTRNLTVFEGLKKQGKLLPRMQYYYGKELFEHGRVMEAIPELEQAVCAENLDVHDRVIATQYLGFAHMQAAEKYNDEHEKARHYAKAISHSQSGILIAPTRAEFYNIIGDSFVKQGRLVEAVPFYKAATGCLTAPNDKVPTPIFRHEEGYGHYPLCQLARVFANMQKFEEARDYARQAFDLAGSNESRMILAEIDRITTAAQSYKLAKPCNDIVFTTPPQHAYPFDPDYAEKNACGGSETAMIEMAKWIGKKANRPVKIFMMRDNVKCFDGVEYRPNTELVGYLAQHKPYLHIAWRHNVKITDAPTFVWSHDLFTPGAEVTENYEKILCLTPWHAKHMNATQGIPMDKIHVTRNGVIAERFKEPIDMDAKDPMQFVFCSSPDRGLDNAMRVLDKVREKFPVKLSVYYGIEHLDKYGLGHLREKLQAMFKERPWVTYKGATQQDALMADMRKAAFCVQPSAWLETSQILAMEMVLCGIYPIVRKIAGVQDTLRVFAENGMAELIEQNGDFSAEHIDIYANRVIAAIEEKKYKRVLANAEDLSWERVAEDWLKDLPALATGTAAR